MAQKRVIIPEGDFAPLPIAIPNFVAGTPADGEVGVGVTQVITNNLKRSGLFAPIDQAAFIDKTINIDVAPNFQNWKTINAQALVTGRMTRQQRRPAEGGIPPVGRQHRASSSPASNISPRRNTGAASRHIISDQIYERLTGEKGYFDSRVVFVDETGSKERRVKRLALMDQDGANVRYLTRGTRSRADAALLAVEPGNHLYGVRPGRSARLSLQHRDRPARDRRQFPRHVVRAALLAGRPARHHEPAAGRQLQPVRDGSALEDRRRG